MGIHFVLQNMSVVLTDIQQVYLSLEIAAVYLHFLVS